MYFQALTIYIFTQISHVKDIVVLPACKDLFKKYYWMDFITCRRSRFYRGDNLIPTHILDPSSIQTPLYPDPTCKLSPPIICFKCSMSLRILYVRREKRELSTLRDVLGESRNQIYTFVQSKLSPSPYF